MGNVVEGAIDKLKVVALNKAGVAVPLPADTAVHVSVATDTVSAVDLSTGDFTFTAGTTLGPDNVTATGGGLTSPAWVETVTQDTTPASLVIQQGP